MNILHLLNKIGLFKQNIIILRYLCNDIFDVLYKEHINTTVLYTVTEYLTMNIPEIKSYEEQAIDAVTSIINRAKESLGLRQTLTQLAGTRDSLATPAKVVLTSLGPPLAVTSERLIAETIEKKWELTNTFMYVLKYMGGSKDECSQHYYFEAIFSQPTPSYPIPQATASVFFRVAEKYIETPEIKVVPMITFTVEGQHKQNDVRYVYLTADEILGVLKMKLKFFKRIENIRLF